MIAGLYRCAAVAAIAVAIVAAAAATSSAQVMHLAPAYRRVLPSDAVILTIKRKPLPPEPRQASQDNIDARATARANAAEAAAIAAATVRLAIDDGQLVVQSPAKPIATIPIGDRLVRDFINQIKADLPDLEVTSDYPLYAASSIGRLQVAPLKPGDSTVVYANSDEPDLRIGFGVVLALAEPKTENETSGILTQTGFQLDVVGSHQLAGAAATHHWARPVVFSQFRLGLNSDQQIQVKPGDAVTDGSEVSSQLDQALGQADQVALSAQLDLEWATWTPKMRLVLTPSYAVNWTRFDTPPFPRIPVDGVATPAEDVFTADALARTKNDWAHVKPLDEANLMLTANFFHHEMPIYYAGLGIARREILVPGFHYIRSSASEGSPGPIDPESLRGLLGRTDVRVWRAVLGTRLAGVMDLRVDASGSIGNERVEPLLRVLIARAFPIGQ
jgi:hypothetical protein